MSTSEPMSADLPGIRARLAAATPGEWSSDEVSRRTWYITAGKWPNGNTRHVAQVSGAGMGWDADLIAHAPTDLTALLAEVERQAAVIDAVRELVDEIGEEISELRGDVPPVGAGRIAHIYRTAGLSDARDRLRAALDHDGTTRRESAADRSQGGFCAADGATSQIPSVAFTEEDE